MPNVLEERQEVMHEMDFENVFADYKGRRLLGVKDEISAENAKSKYEEVSGVRGNGHVVTKLTWNWKT